ncbi:CTP synthase [Candidatus Kuenenbacteria bacterium RIFCSPLOWO2_02_FULL_42_16]|uniref:CTP synthase n=1 Tax=Candidatus Kuenenbacteria bacterium RIFCSPLOWO2_02_FULL_42_16 TaxID=1798564 RepID=A0A1F6FXK1_9BACT|nr:MAG: CTP synthase [Candidatus Kuenenbacteria bacterium RIFCSPLOWO2_02_FULL_42_16]
MQTKYIFVTGGVCSGLGKGIASASIGAILKSCGYKVSIIKMDPYLNPDPGTMSPFQHGEVFVTDDGYEADLDLGHYERFIDIPLSRQANLTTGQIYQELMERERKGEFLGKTVQIVPHVTNKIRDFIKKAAKNTGADFLIIEIGGTVGDIEGEPYLEAARQFHHEAGDNNVMFVHLTLLPFLATSGELKTKPTQMSVKELERRGIHPDMILARSDYHIPRNLLDKIAMFCDVDEQAVIPAPTISSIYEVPLNFAKANVSEIIFKKFGMFEKKPNLRQWQNLVKKIKASNGRQVAIVKVGKYTAHGDAYISVDEALKAAGFANNTKVKVIAVDSEKLESNDKKEWQVLKKADGILVPGGFGKRGIEGKIMAAKYARENKVPYFGLCLGMQIMTIEFARNVLRLKKANSTEFDPKTPAPVIATMLEQRKNIAEKNYGGTMRLGNQRAKLAAGSLSFKAYGQRIISERHRHRYEFNNDYKDAMEKAGLRIAGVNPDRHLVEIVEVKDHPWMVGVQFHPEFKSRPLRPHPLFREFIRAAVKRYKTLKHRKH